MASVQELILAAQAKQNQQPLSMLAQLINSASSGYTEGNNLRNVKSEADLRRAEIIQKLVATQQAQKEMDAQEALRRQFEEKLAVTAEQNLRSKQAGVASPGTAPTPAGKFEQTWTQDEKGKISRSIKEVSPKQADIPAGYRLKSDGSGNMEFIPGGPADPSVKATLDKPVIDRSMKSAITKSKVEVAETRPMVESVTKEIDRVQALNKDSYGGYVGALKMKAKSAMNTGPEDIKFKNTADVLNTMQAQVSKVLKSTFGGQLSDGERQYLNQVYGALPNMSQTERDIAMTNVKTMLTSRLSVAESKLQEISDGAGVESGSETPAQRKARLLQELQGAK